LTTSTSNPVTAARCSGVHPPASARIIAPTAFRASAFAFAVASQTLGEVLELTRP
jgi:hypothetical protein